ncbi:MAG: nucleotide pyrophosphohydrolase [Candidatus Methanomethylophilaceae archaeon]|nr:nucleotide pyrophosphohydrolase [Candidatus Methanomethylophilaceae archaeon]
MAPVDDVTTIRDLKEEVRRFCDERDWEQFHNSKDLAIGIVTEASELLQLMRFKDEGEVGSMMCSERRSEIVDELCDTLYFVLRFAQMNDIDLSSELSRKLEKNALKYPVSKSFGSNKKYDEF